LEKTLEELCEDSVPDGDVSNSFPSCENRFSAARLEAEKQLFAILKNM